MEQLTTRLKHLKVNAIYGHQKHYFASARKTRYHRFIGVPLLLINISIGTVLFKTFSSQGSSLNIIPIIFSYIAAGLSGLQTFFNFEKTAISHKVIAQKYLEIDNHIRNKEAEIESGLITSKKDLAILIENFTDRLNSINIDADKYQTSTSDYKKAQLAFKNNNVSYENIELDT